MSSELMKLVEEMREVVASSERDADAVGASFIALDEWADRIEAIAKARGEAAAWVTPLRHGQQVRAIDDVLAERRRQTEIEGWTAEHDDEHEDGALAAAAACYAMPEDERQYEKRTDERHGGRYVDDQEYATSTVPAQWPKSWAGWWWKPKDRRRDLVRAAALLIAEIERLDRSAQVSGHSEKCGLRFGGESCTCHVTWSPNAEVSR